MLPSAWGDTKPFLVITRQWFCMLYKSCFCETWALWVGWIYIYKRLKDKMHLLLLWDGLLVGLHALCSFIIVYFKGARLRFRYFAGCFLCLWKLMLMSLWEIVLKISQNNSFCNNWGYHHIKKLRCAICMQKKSISHSF